MSKEAASAPATREARRNLSGLESFRRMMAGEFPMPPMVALRGFRLVEVEHGRIVFGAEPTTCTPTELLRAL
jgi:hypothetical protein